MCSKGWEILALRTVVYTDVSSTVEDTQGYTRIHKERVYVKLNNREVSKSSA